METKTHTARIALLAGLISLGAVAAVSVQAREGTQDTASFVEFDLDGNGEVTQAEMDEVRAIKAAERFAAADADGNGELTSEEMLAAAQARMGERMERRIARQFERLDADESGALSAEELEAGREKGRRFDPARIFERMDANDDGVLDAEEFALAQERMEERRGGKGEGKGRKGGQRD